MPVPFDAAGLPALTDALLDAGLDEATIRAVMGENALRLFAETLPPAAAARPAALDQLGDQRRRPRGAVPLHRSRGDGPVDLLRDGLGDRVRVGGVVVHVPAGAVAVEAVADVAVLLEVVAQREVQERPPGRASSIVVVSPPWTTARSHAARCLYSSGT